MCYFLVTSRSTCCNSLTLSHGIGHTLSVTRFALTLIWSVLWALVFQPAHRYYKFCLVWWGASLNWIVLSSLNWDVGKFCLHLFHKQWAELVWDHVKAYGAQLQITANQQKSSLLCCWGIKHPRAAGTCLGAGSALTVVFKMEEHIMKSHQSEWERRTLLLKQGWTSAQLAWQAKWSVITL